MAYQVRYWFLVAFFVLMFLAVFDAITKAMGIVLFETDMVDTITQFVYLVGSGILAIVNFIGDAFGGKFNIDGIIAIAIKLAGWLGFTVVSIVSELIKLPFRIIDLVIGSWVFGGISGEVPTVSQINAIKDNQLLLWLGLDFSEASFSGGFGFRIYHVWYYPMELWGIIDALGWSRVFLVNDDRLFLFVELDIGDLGIGLKGFVFSEINVSFKVLDILKDILEEAADSIGNWETIFDKLIRNEAIL